LTCSDCVLRAIHINQQMLILLFSSRGAGSSAS
jgi:hypothetical protein